jgi:acetyltransferase-like isoleucine patch superfamily enzyme
MKNKLLLIYAWFVRTALFPLPDIPLIMRFRGWLYGMGMNKCGRNFQITHSAILNSLECFEIGDNVYIANFCDFIGNGKIIIENNVLFGPNVVISSGNHTYKDNSFRFGKSTKDDVLVKNGSWIAANCVITAGSIVPEKSIVSAGSVFTKKSCGSPFTIYRGNPAESIKRVNV